MSIPRKTTHFPTHLGKSTRRPVDPSCMFSRHLARRFHLQRRFPCISCCSSFFLRCSVSSRKFRNFPAHTERATVLTTTPRSAAGRLGHYPRRWNVHRQAFSFLLWAIFQLLQVIKEVSQLFFFRVPLRENALRSNT